MLPAVCSRGRNFVKYILEFENQILSHNAIGDFPEEE